MLYKSQENNFEIFHRKANSIFCLYIINSIKIDNGSGHCTKRRQILRMPIVIFTKKYKCENLSLTFYLMFLYVLYILFLLFQYLVAVEHSAILTKKTM